MVTPSTHPPCSSRASAVSFVVLQNLVRTMLAGCSCPDSPCNPLTAVADLHQDAVKHGDRLETRLVKQGVPEVEARRIVRNAGAVQSTYLGC
jgi:hypothetical protein